jgi:hypothetical protein
MENVMRNALVLALLGVTISVVSAHAQCTTYPYTLTNGTTADASQVMSDFNYLAGCLAPRTTPSITGPASFAAPNTATATASFTAPNATNGTAVFATAPTGSMGVAVGGYATTAGSSGIVGSSTGTSGVGVYGSATGTGGTAVYANGTAGGTGNWTNLSDERLKKNIQQITGALNAVEKLRGVRYQWRSATERTVGKTMNLPEDRTEIGFVAQEVQSVVPEAVTERTVKTDQIYALESAALIPVLVEAIKEQQTEIEQLRTAVATLQRGK